jgi:hypothetical protein
MRLLVSAGLVAALVAGRQVWQPTAVAAPAPAPVPLLSWHFAGTQALQGNTNGLALREILAQASTRQVVEASMEHLARAPERLFATELRTGQPVPATLIRPLLDDALRHESWGALQSVADQVTELTLAARLDETASARWEKNWQAVVAALGAPKPVALRGKPGAGWEAHWSGGSTVSRFFRDGNVSFISLGRTPLHTDAAVASRVRSGSRGGNDWLTVEADPAGLAHLLHVPATPDWPQVRLSVAGQGQYLRSQARLEFAAPLHLKLDPWRVPTNTISDPIISFTAVRGLQDWLAARGEIRRLGVPAPNQAFGWARAQIPFATFFAWPWPGASNQLPTLATHLPAVATNWFPHINVGQITYETNFHRAAWVRLPILVPFIVPAGPPEEDFVLAGLFPITAPHRPVPAELIDQLGASPNLVYYDWEITEGRVEGWRNLAAIHGMLSGYEPPPTNSLALLWLADTNVTRFLGNSVTTVSVVSPKELLATRTSSAGLTGFELTLLRRWLDDPEFPKLSEPPSVFARHHRSRPPGMTPPAVRPRSPAVQAAPPPATPKPTAP